jgi:hypothetical protein
MTTYDSRPTTRVNRLVDWSSNSHLSSEARPAARSPRKIVSRCPRNIVISLSPRAFWDKVAHQPRSIVIEYAAITSGTGRLQETPFYHKCPALFNHKTLGFFSSPRDKDI